MNTLPHEWFGDIATYLPKKDLVTFIKVDSYVYLSLLISCFKLDTMEYQISNRMCNFTSYNYFQYKYFGNLNHPFYEVTYINSQKHGVYIRYNSQGVICETDSYNKNRKHGLGITWVNNNAIYLELFNNKRLIFNTSDKFMWAKSRYSDSDTDTDSDDSDYPDDLYEFAMKD